MVKLETSLVDGGAVEHRRLRHLHYLGSAEDIVSTLRQREAADPVVFREVMIVAVARDQRVLRVDRVINARADRGETSRYEQPFADRDQIKRWVKDRGSEQSM